MKHFSSFYLNLIICLIDYFYFQDVSLSKELIKKFREHVSNSASPLSVDFNIMVLSSGSWPFGQGCSFSLPPVLERCVNR